MGSPEMIKVLETEVAKTLEKLDKIQALLEALKAYDFVMDLPAYKHNFDYHLTLLIMSNR